MLTITPRALLEHNCQLRLHAEKDPSQVHVDHLMPDFFGVIGGAGADAVNAGVVQREVEPAESLTVDWTMPSTSLGFVTSALTEMACPPAAVIACAVTSASLAATSATTTFAPSFARAMAEPRPKPEAPPVTRATLPENCCVTMLESQWVASRVIRCFSMARQAVLLAARTRLINPANRASWVNPCL